MELYNFFQCMYRGSEYFFTVYCIWLQWWCLKINYSNESSDIKKETKSIILMNSPPESRSKGPFGSRIVCLFLGRQAWAGDTATDLLKVTEASVEDVHFILLMLQLCPFYLSLALLRIPGNFISHWTNWYFDETAIILFGIIWYNFLYKLTANCSMFILLLCSLRLVVWHRSSPPRGVTQQCSARMQWRVEHALAR